jgi:hypothetical protein
MTDPGRKQLLDGWPWFRGEGSYPILPHSEFMPPVRLLRKPYGSWDMGLFSEDDPWGWPVTEYEEELTLRPGLHGIAKQILDQLDTLWGHRTLDGGTEFQLRDNPFWPREMAERAGALWRTSCASGIRMVALVAPCSARWPAAAGPFSNYFSSREP